VKWLDEIWDWFSNLIPVERWIRSINNVLRYLSLAFILIFILILALILRDWGFSPNQRTLLIVIFACLLLAALLIAMFLAIRRGDLLHSPYERSLRRGARFGTEKVPLQKTEAERLPAEPMQSMLRTGQSEETTK
jgi:small-conductance mechanosensitive channel